MWNITQPTPYTIKYEQYLITHAYRSKPEGISCTRMRLQCSANRGRKHTTVRVRGTSRPALATKSQRATKSSTPACDFVACDFAECYKVAARYRWYGRAVRAMATIQHTYETPCCPFPVTVTPQVLKTSPRPKKLCRRYLETKRDGSSQDY